MSGWLVSFLLGLSPLLLLVVLLTLGRYPGEKAIHRYRRVLSLLLSPGRASRKVLLVTSRSCVPMRGGRLIASSLAGRGPPFTA